MLFTAIDQTRPQAPNRFFCCSSIGVVSCAPSIRLVSCADIGVERRRGRKLRFRMREISSILLSLYAYMPKFILVFVATVSVASKLNSTSSMFDHQSSSSSSSSPVNSTMSSSSLTFFASSLTCLASNLAFLASSLSFLSLTEASSFCRAATIGFCRAATIGRLARGRSRT